MIYRCRFGYLKWSQWRIYFYFKFNFIFVTISNKLQTPINNYCLRFAKIVCSMKRSTYVVVLFEKMLLFWARANHYSSPSYHIFSNSSITMAICSPYTDFGWKKTRKYGRCFYLNSTEIAKVENVIYNHLKYVIRLCDMFLSFFSLFP